MSDVSQSSRSIKRTAAWCMAISLAAMIVILIAWVQRSAALQDGSSAYVPPRTADGKPDLNGVWQAVNTASWDIQDHAASPDVPAGQGVVEGNDLPYQDWALAKRNEHSANKAVDPFDKCYLPGIPRATYMPFPFQIAQGPKVVVMAYEYARAVRRIFIDSPHPPGPLDFWMGDPRGRWEGDTLVVDSIHFTDQTWFDRKGNFHSNGLHVVERFTRTGPDHLQYEATIDDPKVFTRPWKMSMPLYRRKEPNIRVLEYDCVSWELDELAEGIRQARRR